MVFGLFKKSKKSKHKFDSKLIKKFHKDHKKLVKHIENVLKEKEIGNTTKAKQHLARLKIDILGHFMEEDIKLYWYLKDYYKEEQDIESIIKNFKQSIKEIQKNVIRFLDYYTQENVALDAGFDKEFSGIIEALSTRIESEENNLYPLYIQ